MAEKKEFWTEQRLKTGIYVLIAGIIVVIIAMAGWWFYLNYQWSPVPDVIQQTIDTAKKEIKKNPNSVNGHINLAQAYIQAKMYNEAIAECQTILKLDKENDFGMALMGVAYEGKGNIKSAIQYYQKAISTGESKQYGAMNPAVTESRFRLGKIYIEQNKLKEAFDLFKYAAEVNTMDSDAKYYLGLVLYRQGKYDEAITELQAAVRFVPDYYEANYMLGQAYEKKGQKKEAIAAYKEALKYKSDYTKAKDALAKLEQ